MANIIQYQPQVSPNAAVANAASIGTGMNKFGQDVNEGLMYGLHGLRQGLEQTRLVNENTLDATSDQVATEVRAGLERDMDSAYRERVQKKNWALFEDTTTPMITSAYSDENLKNLIAAKFDREPPARMLPLVRSKLRYSQKEYFEQARTLSAKLNIQADDITTDERRGAFQDSLQKGTPDEINGALENYHEFLQARADRLTLDRTKIPALMSDAAHTGLRVRLARDLEAGSVTAYEDHKKLLQAWMPHLTGDVARMEAAALKGDRDAFYAEQKAKVREMAATAKGVAPPEMEKELAEFYKLPTSEVRDIFTDENHKALESRKKADERAEYGKKKNSERTLDDFTIKYMDAYSGDQKALHIRTQMIDKFFEGAKDGMTAEDRVKLAERVKHMKEQAANVVTDPAVFANLRGLVLSNPNAARTTDSIVYAQNVSGQDKKELLNSVFALRKEFADDRKRSLHEHALKTFELKSAMFSEVPSTIASSAQVEVLNTLSEVILEGQNSERPYIREQWTKYQRNPSEMMDSLMVEQLKVAKKLTIQRGKEVYDGLLIKPDSPAMTREITKRMDATTDEGKNAITALQMYMNTIYPNLRQQQSLQDAADTKQLKEDAKKIERKK